VGIGLGHQLTTAVSAWVSLSAIPSSVQCGWWCSRWWFPPILGVVLASILGVVFCPMAAPVFSEPVLAFIKAFCIRGHVTALKQAALSCFSIPMLFSAKKSLWEFCDADLSLLDVPFSPRHSSEKCTQAAADLEDILLAFSKLDEADKIPQIFCEATDLVKLPPIAADPITWQQGLPSGNRRQDLSITCSDYCSSGIHI